MTVAVVVLTYNEEIHLDRALTSVASFATSIHVIDSGSTDATADIARRHGAELLVHPFRNQADQFQWGMDNITTDAEWILRLDADEIIEPDLAERIRTEIDTLPADVTGVNLDRKHIFMDRWVRHGGRYPLRMLRLFRRGQGRVEQRWMDEHIIVESGRTIVFPGGFADHNLNDLGYFIDKHNKYATREAVDVLNRKYDLFARDHNVTSQSSSRQAALKRWVKEEVYNRVPFTVSSLGYFLFRYIVQLGFLDGRRGLVYHFLQGYWYRFLVGAKVMELDKLLSGAPNNLARIAIIERETGLRLSERTGVDL